MGAAGAVATKRTECPRCRGFSTVPLARDGDKQRHQCLSCSENFTLPAVPELSTAPPEPHRGASGIAHAPLSIPDAGLSSGGPKATCGKCGRPYFRLGDRYEKHVAACDGNKKWAAPRRREARKAAPAAALVQGATRTYELYLETLRARKTVLEAEIRSVDGLIAEVDKARAAPVVS